MNRVVSQILARPDPLPATPPANMGLREEENALHVPVNEQSGSGIQFIGIQSGDEADTNADDPRESVERASEDPDLAQPLAGGVDSSGDEGDEGHEVYAENDGGSEDVDSDTLPISDIPTRVPQLARISGGVSFKPEDHTAMVQFVSELDHKPVKADWETFRSLVRDQY